MGKIGTDGENWEGWEGFTKGNETFGVMGMFIVLMVVIDCFLKIGLCQENKKINKKRKPQDTLLKS